MIGFFGKHQKTLLLIVMVPIIASFVFWGAGKGRGSKRNNPVMGELGGEKITLEQLRDAVAAARQTQQAESNEQLLMMGWRHILLLSEAEKWGLEVSREELSRYIQGIFSGEEEFDLEKYEQFLANRRMNVTDFENQARQNMLVFKLNALVGSTTQVSPSEVREQYDVLKTRVKLKYHKISNDSIIPALTMQGRAKEYFLMNQDQFQAPRRIKAKYVVVASKEKAEELFSGASAADMGRIARENNLKLRQAKVVGDETVVDDFLGASPDFASMAKSTPPGELSQVITSEKGAIVLVVEEIMEKGLAEFDDVAADITKKLREDEERENIAKNAKLFELSDYVDSGYDLMSVSRSDYNSAAEYYLRYRKLDNTLTIPSKRRVLYVLIDMDDQDRFKLKETITEEDIKTYYNAHKDRFLDDEIKFIPYENATGDVKAQIEKELKDKYVITSEDVEKYYEDNVAEFTSADGPVDPLEQVEQQIISKLQKDKRREMAREAADEMFVIYSPERMRWLADRNNLPLRETGLFGIDDEVDEYIGDSVQFKQAAFSTSIGSVSSLVETDRGFSILCPIESYPAEESTPASLAQAYEQAIGASASQKASEYVGQTIQAMYNAVNRMSSGKEGVSFETACASLGLPVEETDWISRLDQTPSSAGSINELSFSEGEKTITPFEMDLNELSPATRTSDGGLFYSISEIEAPSDEKFEEEKEEFTSRFRYVRRQSVVNEWLGQLQEERELDIYRKK
jgi:parvulin-like peptidyl-prolyl isomerase